jgi:exoribonuclease R
MRARRMTAGCLTMNVPKLHFTLDEAGNPTGVKLYPYMESNRLIEEFMLLSNMAVARRITASFSDTSLLRIHPPPAEGTLVNVSQFCRAHGLPTPASFSSFDMQMVRFCRVAFTDVTAHIALARVSHIALPRVLIFNTQCSG